MLNSTWFRPFVVVLLLALLYSVWVVNTSQHPLSLATIGTRYAPPDLTPFAYSEEGYDGQFAYYIARYGWDSQAYLDVPAYRFQRILLPFLGRIASFGTQEGLIWGLFGVNLLVVGVSAWALEQLLTALKVSRWFALGITLSIGILGGVRLTTTEPLAYGLVILGIRAFQHNRLKQLVLWFALAGLAKETALVFPFAMGVYALVARKWQLAGYMSLTVFPFLAWQGVLYSAFGTLGIGSGGALATSFELIPLMGVVRILTEGNLSVFLLLIPFIGGFVLLPTFWGLWACWQDKNWSIWTYFLLFNALLMLFVPFSTYRELLGILRFIVGLQISVVLYSAHTRQRRALLYSTLWSLTTLLIIFSDSSTLKPLNFSAWAGTLF